MQSKSTLKKDAVAIFKAGLEAVDPVHAVKKHLRLAGNILEVGKQRYDLSRFQRIYLVGAGKASAAMAKAAEDILDSRITNGIINVKYGHSLPLERTRINEAGHPLPDDSGLKGAQQIAELVRSAGENDLILFLVSGGGSALLPLPAPGITLKDKQDLTQILLDSGAAIHEINALRKHVSQLKGGHLARLAFPATLVSLILSDVIDDDLDVIASGPAVPDSSTFSQCLKILEKYRIEDEIPTGIRDRIMRGVQRQIEETPKPGDPVFRRTAHLIVASNIQAAEHALKKAVRMGYNSLLLSTYIAGETSEAARFHTAVAKEITATGNPVSKPACIISGGETTVTIHGKGLGGRNQEFALAAALELEGLKNTAVLSGGTDGTDGPTDAAGAFADGTTLSRARSLGLDAVEFLKNNDSYHFFEKLRDLIKTGPTRTNVMDLHIMLIT